MRMLTLLLVLLLVSPLAARGQDVTADEGTRISAAEVSGISMDQLSPGLRKEIASLSGSTLSRAALRQLAGRIEAEQPGTVAAVRSVDQPDGAVRLVFLVARINESDDLQANINARYTVESVDISGIEERFVRAGVRDQLQTLVGKPMDPQEVERLEDVLDASLPDHDVARRVERGTQPGQVKVIFDVTDGPRRLVQFSNGRSQLLYHAFQGWSGVLELPVTSGNHQLTIGGVVENEDDLVEQYSGWRFRYETRRLGTDRLGASIEYSTLRQSWREATLDAVDAGGLPVAYRARRTIEPLLTFAFDRQVKVTGGVSVSDLESLSRSPDSQMASAVVLGASFERSWSAPDSGTHRVSANYQVRDASESLNSDLDYTRHLARFSYLFNRRRSTIAAHTMFGGTSGTPPMFERFTLGDTRTLRGWNKYDIAPAGASRMFSQIVSYRYGPIGAFLDSGMLWEPDTDLTARFSTGVVFNGGPFFAVFAVPLNADDVRVTFMMGVRATTRFSF